MFLPRRSWLFLVNFLCHLIAQDGRVLAAKTTLVGGGSTSVQKVFQAVVPKLNKDHGVKISYVSEGSGIARANLISGRFEYCVTNVPFASSEEAKLKVTKVTLPFALSTISVFTYIPGYNTLKINLTPKLVALIFTRKITTWADARIRALNPTLKVAASQAIYVVRRSDNAGATQLLSQWLSVKASSVWHYPVSGVLSWPAGTIAAVGSSGAAAAMRATPFSIGYLSISVAYNQGLNEAYLENSAGFFLTSATSNPYESLPRNPPSATASWAGITLVNAIGQQAWPLTTFAYLVTRKNQVQLKRSGGLLKSFLLYMMSPAGQAYCTKYNLFPAPTKLITQNKGAIGSIVLALGVPIPF
eukprot:TRINITY_DN21102_c0_g1_i1.p1 TRINITY_DN21102_c0_g1~~TRINITY_DN21102_c0_g1_i1.p1  ORF type:complete len:358 (-),score=14.69 TRINITY_DN21102_c0_g1_i1:1462-2535(-)